MIVIVTPDIAQSVVFCPETGMEVINSSPAPFLPFREKCCHNFERFSPVRLRKNRRESVEGSSVASRVLENLNNSFNRYSALNLSGRKEVKSKDIADDVSIGDIGKHFNRSSALNLSGRMKDDKEFKSKMENMKTTLTKDINTIREAITSIPSPHSYNKRKHSNLINEDREEIAAVDMTIDLCDTIKHDDDEKVDIPTVKRRKLFKDGGKD